MPAGPPLTQARRIAAESSLPDRRWLMPAGRRPRLTDPAVCGRWCRRPRLTQARRSREITPPSAAHRARRLREMTPPPAAHPGPPFTGDHAAVRGSPSPPFAGDDAAIRGSPTPPFAGDHAAARGSPRPAVRGRSRRRPWGKPTHRPRLPIVRRPRGKPTRRPRLTRPATAVASSSPPAPAVDGQASRLPPFIVKPASYGPASRPPPYLTSQLAVAVYWPATDQSHFKSCSSLSSPGGLLMPPSCPMDFFGGGTKVPAVVAGPRDEVTATATATKDHLPWPPELPALPWPPSVCSALEAPSCVCICVCPEGPPECLPGGGSYVRPLSCVSCVPASCFHIWFVSCPRLRWLLVNSVPGVYLWLCVNYPVYLVPVCWVPFRLVYSLLPVFLSVCLALSYPDVLIKDNYLSLRSRLRVLFPPCCVHRDTHIPPQFEPDL